MNTLIRSFAVFGMVVGVIVSGVANDCSTANLITSEEDIADSQVAGTMTGAGFSGSAQCSGPDGRDDMWYRFVAVATKHGVVATGSGDLTLAIEVYDACGGAQLACRPSTGSTTVASLSNLTPGNTYYYRLYHDGGAPATSDAFTTGVLHIPFVELQSSDCGTLDFTTNDIIRATTPSNTQNFTNYQFRFTELEAPFNTYTITSPNGTNPNFRLQWFPQLEYGRTYEVSVRVRAIVPTYGDFGNTCVIGLQQDVMATELEPQYVNGFFGFCDWVGARGVGLATQYRWRFLNINTADVSIAYGDNNQRLLRLSSVPDLQLGETYLVSVYATVAGEESPDGPFRFLNMNNFVPNTGIRQDIYSCGATYPISSNLQAVEICEADSYTWRFRNTSQSQPDLIYTRTGGNRFIKLNWVAGLNVGDSYDVDVKANQGGLAGDYSAVCNITIGASLNPNLLVLDDYVLMEQSAETGDHPALDLPTLGDIVEARDEMSPWSLSAYPETGGGSYSVILSGGDRSGDVMVEVYDLNGRLVAQRRMAAVTAGQTTWRLDGLTRGVYVVRAVGDAHFETEKITVF